MTVENPNESQDFVENIGERSRASQPHRLSPELSGPRRDLPAGWPASRQRTENRFNLAALAGGARCAGGDQLLTGDKDPAQRPSSTLD